METSTLTFYKHEVGVIMPGLDLIFKEMGTPFGCLTELQFRANEVYRDRCLDEEMGDYVLSCRNKLKFTGAWCVVDLNCFEFAAAANAFRVVRKEKLVSKDMLASPSVAGLERKIENARRCAKRSAIKQIGPASYKEKADRWGHFVEWMRFNLLSPRLRRKTRNGVWLLRKEQRETMRELAMQVVVETADQTQIYHLADLARREIRRGRHGTTLRALLADHDKARQFLAIFFLKRLDPEILVPEFQPLCVLQSNCGEQLKRALQLDAD